MPTYPEPINMSGVSGILDYANSVTGGYYGWLILVAIYISGFLWLLGRNYSPAESAAGVGFVTVFAAVFLKFLELISNEVMYITIIALIVPIAWMYFSETR